ncbi:MAG TPA: CHAT domain-containing protein [Acidobacteriota bacterium]|nr:CHAT domain-containing protein [Acidobacteriota bacterium]
MAFFWQTLRTSKRVHLVLAVVALTAWSQLVQVPVVVLSYGQTPESPGKPNDGKQLPDSEQKLNPGEKQTFPLTLKVGDYLRVRVEQKGIDVVVRLLEPTGKIKNEVDSPNGTVGPESLILLCEHEGRYTLEIESLDKQAPPGMYLIKLESLRPATAQDRTEIEVEKLRSQKANLAQAGKYDEALTPIQHALTLAEQTFPPDHALIAYCLEELGDIYRIKGDFEKAEPLLLRAQAIFEKTLGPDHEDTATCLSILAALYDTKDDFVKTEPLLVRALAIYEKVLGPDHSYVATSLNNLARFYMNRGNYEKARSLFRRSLAIYEKTLGPEHEYTAACLTNLASLAHTNSNFSEAVALLKQALNIFEKAIGTDHPTTAICRNNLAEAYRELGDYTRIEPLYRQCLASFEKSVGPDHPYVGFIYNNLGNLYHDRGDYTQAETCYLRSLAIREKALGPDHLDVAQSLNNLASLMMEKGDLVQAEPLLQRSLAIRKNVLGPDHPDVALMLTNLGALYERRNDYAQAEQYNQQALAIYSQKFGQNHRSIAASLKNLAVIYTNQNRFSEAESLLQRSQAIFETVFGPVHPEVAENLIQMANVYATKGDYNQALPPAHRALAIREKTFGTGHPNVAWSLYKLALLHLDNGEPVQSLPFLIRGNDTTEQDLNLNLVSGSERQKALYLKRTEQMSDITLALHLQYLFQNPTAAQAAFEVLLRRKGRPLDVMTNAIAVLRSRSDSKTQALLDDYASVASQVAVQMLRGPGKKAPADHQAELQALERQKETLEAEISRRSNEFKVQTAPITFEAVKQRIPPNAALIEFTVYHSYDTKLRKPGKPHYAAYVLKGSPDAKGSNPPQLQWVDLGETEPIDQAISQWRQVLRLPSSQLNQPRNLTVVPDQQPVLPSVKEQARLLDRLLMQPVRQLAASCKRFLISPDGALNLIPFDALVDEHGHYLVENYEISFLTSGRDLLRLETSIPPKSKPVVIADPDFSIGKGPVVFQHYVKPLVGLPGTKKEAAAIQAQFPQAVIETQAGATEASLKRVSGPQFLHIATHGYFLDDVRQTPEAATRQAESDARVNLEELKKANPLLRSMIFLARANEGRTGDDDGVLTALEATSLDLWGTKLVVLSACDTGIGEIKNGDGVFGLRRALVLAGAETQLMSLWPVSDTATRDMMIHYYQRLKAGEGRSAALRKVRLEFLNDPKRRHPFYWASFILSGEWGNLEGKR